MYDLVFDSEYDIMQGSNLMEILGGGEELKILIDRGQLSCYRMA